MDIATFNTAQNRASLPTIMAAILDAFGARVVVASSLSIEDQVLTHYWVKACQVKGVDPAIFVLDTGRLNPETYTVLVETERQYGFRYRVYSPDTEAVEGLVRNHGINGFYHSVDARKQCCYVRKVQPLQRALDPYDAWVTGLRRLQSPDRANLPLAEFDSGNSITKFNPLIQWTEAQLLAVVDAENIPMNELYSQGYTSIGCAPCTRAIQPGESNRSGRWWWEASTKECGLHVVDGKLIRKDQEGH
ncbi:MAG: phosphoadenylyl-sulfate reductase [Candidatus Marinamargulisbacteria bacterium]|jgi:phosphoadenosine phosphosulfate reductase|nr:phosphoadenylyl-sulfate reductase [bacterium]MDG2265015.1 phosphoadenylyl-sulfate reductase [Candidatus Marinamargulisbacteria bacterium]|tara:strand:- start:23048 stop:23788 length:741 start_codon:yes stop_codon:yes gene_type:complete